MLRNKPILLASAELYTTDASTLSSPLSCRLLRFIFSILIALFMLPQAKCIYTEGYRIQVV